jgi:tripeptide aminopeptidase
VASVALLKRAFKELGQTPAIDIVITGNVGEEGLGDLRGMRAVVDALPDIAGAIAVEGHLLGRLTHRAVGSKRLKVTVTGAGGHSWGKAGEPSAIHHLARIVARLDDIPLQDDPKTSFNAGLFSGGISVNTIAPEAVAILDMRSTSADALADLVADVERVIGMPTPHGIKVVTEVVGDRPAGENPRHEGLAPIADSVLRELGFDVHYDASSTDANVPISRGIPAICIGLTTGANAHRTDEFIRISPLVKGFAQLVMTTLRSAEALARS